MTARRRRALTYAAAVFLLLGIAVGFGPRPKVHAVPDDAASPAVATAEVAAARVVAVPETTCASGYVALTFDDGPSPTFTDPLLDYLEAAKVPATFFVQGVRAQAYPEPVQRAAKAGFAIGNHSWDHPHLPRLSDARITGELTRTSDLLRSLGIDAGTRVRTPYGEDGPRVLAIVNSLGGRPIRWNDDSEDYARGSGSEIADRVLAGLTPNTVNVVLEHDGIDGPNPLTGRVVAAQTLDAVPRIVAAARAAGYCFTEFGLDSTPMVPAPRWTAHGWVAAPKAQG